MILDAKEAEDKHLLAVHSQNHVNQIKNINSMSAYNYKFNSVYFNEGSTKSAYLAAGGAIEVYFNYLLYITLQIHHDYI